MIEDINLCKTNNSYYLVKIKSKEELKNYECDGFLIDTNSNEKETRRILDSIRKTKKIIVIVGGDNIYNRRVLETMNINYLVSPEKTDKKDNLKQRDSGFNHVLAKIAKKKNISILINFNEIKSLSDKEQINVIQRLIQNIKICRKSFCNIKIASFAKNSSEILTPLQRQEFLISLGASTKQAKEAVKF